MNPSYMLNILRYLTILAFMCAHSPSLHAQVVPPSKDRPPGLGESVFGLGLFGGPATGLGLSFRHHLPHSVSYQITGGIVNVSDRLSYDIGTELQYDLARSASNRFYVGGGLSYFHSSKTGGTNEMKAPGRLGLGVGGEFAVDPGIHTMLDLMFTYFTDGTILPLPQLGFYYYFY